ncbi:glucose PTS transporter subunit IIA [Mesoplasma florum]|uniref:glucose PTS transporter subunit IIA n=1 Tax=Mesoplasma florum TaxID=2151 RepID=UPI000BE256A9|nr:glucose PTS transporter subunit IIA [Mesoplasma florum]ATI72969.1 hypothetical protein CQZ69_00075 [Mesoplasma florum]AVN61372.1 hypothetical protein CG004_00075 [Mesoplasma florum]
MKIKIYAPVDCKAKNIEKCSDPTFSQKILGEGILIIPQKNEFSLPFDEGVSTLIFDTKHAYGFKVKGIDVLIHCGLETVSLGGKYFNSKVVEGKKYKKNDLIFEVDIEKIKKLDISIETPIVFDNSMQNAEMKILDFKEGNFKKGDFLCELEVIEKESTFDLETIFGQEGKYLRLANELINLVGTKANFEDVYNCMTRLRFKIIDKSKINETEILKNKNVRGINWNGQEFQIIIGQDVYKVKDEIVKTLAFQASISQEDIAKTNLFNKILKNFSAVFIKIVPITAGIGLIMALISILRMFNLMPDISLINPEQGSSQIWIFDESLSIVWVILFIVGKTSGLFLGLTLSVSAAVHFKWNPIQGAILGIILCSPLLYGNGGAMMQGQKEWVLFEMWHSKDVMLQRMGRISINMMNLKVGVVIFSVYIACEFDKWIKKWMPASLDLLFRPLLIFLVIPFAGFFIFGPIWNIFEGLFGYVIGLMLKMPLGVGLGIFAAVFQASVIFGLHTILATFFMLDAIANNMVGRVVVIGSISTYAQIAALVGLLIVTKDKKLKKQGSSLIAAGLLGITEPILYGVNFPKRKPLYAGCIGAFFGGCLANIFDITQRPGGGLGIFDVIGFFSDPLIPVEGLLPNSVNGTLYLLCCAVTISVSIFVSMALYKEKTSEKTMLVKLFNKVIYLKKREDSLSNEQIKLIKELKKEIKNNVSKEEKKQLNMEEKNIINHQKALANLEFFIKKVENKKENLIKKGKKAMKFDNLDKANKIALKIKQLDNYIKFENLNSKVSIAEAKINKVKINDICNNIYNKNLNSFNKINQIFVLENSVNLNDEIKNISKNILIYWGYEEKTEINNSENIYNVVNNLNKNNKNERRNLKWLKI